MSVFTLLPGNDGVVTLAMSPREKELVAVGCRSGAVCLVDAVLGTVRHRMVDAHDQEVQGVAWRDLGLERELWLASSSRDKTIKVWRVDSDTKAEAPAVIHSLQLPTGKQGQGYNPSKQLWLPVAWSSSVGDDGDASTVRLWSGSFDGNLLLWELPTGDTSKKSRQIKPVAVKNGHNRILFGIVPVPREGNQPAADSSPTLLTVSLDRDLRLWEEHSVKKGSAATARTVARLLGLGGHVYSAAYNAQASIVALGSGDQTIRLWKVSSAASSYDTELMWKGLKSKITSVAWHPLQSSTLAYGTEDGSLGIYDIQSKTHTRLKSSHNGQVDDLQWRIAATSANSNGESDGAGSTSFVDAIRELEQAQASGSSLEDALTAQASRPLSSGRQEPAVQVLLWSRDTTGRILESDTEHTNAQSKVVETKCSAFAWSNRNDLVAIGRSNGSVEVLEWSSTGSKKPDISLAKLHDHQDRVTCVTWSSKANGDAMSNFFVSGGEDGQIFVYAIEPSTLSSKLVARFAGHSGKITNLRWQPSSEDGAGDSRLIGSCSADGTARVWDMDTRAQVAVFGDHVGRVLALDWLSDSVLVTGGEDQTARVWDLHDQPSELAAPLAKQSSTKNPSTTRVDTNGGTKPAKTVDASTTVSSSVKTESKPVPSQPTAVKKKKKAKSHAMFFHSDRPTPPDEVANALARQSAGPVGYQTSQFDGGFALAWHDDSVRGLLLREQAQYVSKGDWEQQARVLLLRGKVGEALRVVAKEGALSPTWLALAPSAGLDVWRELTNLYALQLEQQGDASGAATHYLSIGKVRAAVRALVSGFAFREALSLVQLRLPPGDPLISETAMAYAEHLESREQFADAALIYASLERTSDSTWRAVRALVRTGSASCISHAVELLHSAAAASSGLELSVPATFVVNDMVGGLVRAGAFSSAKRASELLSLPPTSCLSVPSSRPMATTAAHLLQCLVGILSALDVHVKGANEYLSSSGGSIADLNEWRQQYPACETVELVVALQQMPVVAQCPSWITEQSVSSAEMFWAQVLTICRTCGIWSDTNDSSSDERLAEAQELLLDDESWMIREWRDAFSSSPSLHGDMVATGIGLIRFVVDTLCRCLISGLEHLRHAMTDALDAPNELAVKVMTLIFPGGVATKWATAADRLAIGELADEQQDAEELWEALRVLQCRVLAKSSTLNAEAAKETAALVREALEETSMQQPEVEELMKQLETLEVTADAGSVAAATNGHETEE